MADDVRLTRWDLTANAGMTRQLVFTADDTLTSLSLYTGGTVSDVDDLTDATEHAGTLSTTTVSNDTATVDLTVGTDQTHLRLVVNGVVQTVGRLHASTNGTASPDSTINLTAGTATFTLTVLGGIADNVVTWG